MQINLNKKTFLVMLLIWLTSFSAWAQSGNSSDPVAMLKSVADQMIAGLKSHKANLKNNPTYVYSLANKVVVPHANLTEMSKRVIPPKVWEKATEAQKAQFKREFTTLLIRTYASALSSYDDQAVQFTPIRGGYEGKSTIEVKSQIVSSDNAPVAVLYRLMRVGSNWQLYDLSVEGVSLIESFRSQFAGILSQGDMNLLLQRLSGHNTRDTDS